MLFSIIIPTRNRSVSLQKSLEALHTCLDDPNDVEICIVDDCSHKTEQDKNSALCSRYGYKYQYCSLHKGPAHARNTGLYGTSGEWVAFLDDDVCVDPAWFTTLKTAVIHASATIVGIEGVTRSQGNGLWDSEVENPRGGLYLTSNCTYRRETLMQCNGFDETFYGPCAEDQELAVRIKKFGSIRFEQNCIVCHQPRTIRWFSYCAGAFARMKMLLDAEWYFYAKHRDRYHTLRYAPTFREGYAAMLLKHCWITLKRRGIKRLRKQPAQAFVLGIAALLEQCAAWLLLPRYIIRALKRPAPSSLLSIDTKATETFWQLQKQTSLAALQFKPSPVRSLLFRIHRYPCYNAAKLLQKIAPQTTGTDARVFLRIDDMFCNDPGLLDRFCTVMSSRKNISFLAAVTGNDLRNPENRPLLDAITEAGGRIALHGVTHTGSFGPYPSEVLQMDYPALKRLGEYRSDLVSDRHRPIAFIPPFNAIAWDQIIMLSKTFPLICGGPETLRFTNYFSGPIVLDTGGIYFPSCHPFYGTAKQCLHPRLQKTVMQVNAPICFTFHLHAEACDNFENLKNWCDRYAACVTDWSTLITKGAARVTS